LTSPGEDLYHPTYRIGPVDHASGPSQDLDSIHVVRGHIGPVEGATRLIRGYPIDEYLDVIALPASKKYRADSSEGPSLHHRRARDLAQRVLHEANTASAKVVTGNDGH
jgi:hypothetical protein